MRLTDEQRAELAKAVDDCGYRRTPILTDMLVDDFLAPLIESWLEDGCSQAMSDVMDARPLTAPSPSGAERVEWAIRHEYQGDVRYAPGGESWARYFADPEHRRELGEMLRSVVDSARVVRRAVWESPWEEA